MVLVIEFISLISLRSPPKIGLDMEVRDDNGNILDINQTSTTQLYEQHVQATNRIRRATVSEYLIKFLFSQSQILSFKNGDRRISTRIEHQNK
jgi:hypothetical protein